MARLCSIATGNNTSASTWALIDSTSFNESETSSATVPTSYSTSYTQFVPGAITIDALGFRIANRTGTTGTFSIELYDHTAGASVAGTEVTINCSDFVDASSTHLDGGWYCFKFSSPVTLTGGNSYSVRFKTSSSNQITFYGASTTNPSRFLRTTTTQAPAAGDDRFVMGEWTAAATTSTFTVTGDDTANTDYGSGSTSLVTPALSISAGGSYIFGTSASTTYLHKLSGNCIVYNGGILRAGTSGSRMPTTSSLVWTFDSVANVDFGLTVKRKGEATFYGESKTRWTTLTGDEAAAQTVIGVADTTGWKAGDTLVFAPTGNTVNQAETKVIDSVDSSTQVTLTAGLTNAHTGTGDVIGEVGNLSSNVKIVGASSTLGTYVTFKDSSIGVLDNVEVQYMGSAIASKRGVQIEHTTPSINDVTLNNCAFRDFSHSNGFVGTAINTCSFFTITNNVIYSANGSMLTINASFGTPTYDVSDNLIIGSGSPFIGMSVNVITGASATMSGNVIAGFSSSGLTLSGSFTANEVSNFSGFKIHSNTTGIASSSTLTKIITSFDIVCNNSNGVGSIGGVATFNNCNFIGNGSSGAAIGVSSNIFTNEVTFNSCVFRGRTSFNQSSGISLANGAYQNAIKLTLNSCTFGDTVAHTSSDVTVSSLFGGIAIFNSCTFNSSTEFISTIHSLISSEGYIGVQRKDNTDGNHLAYVRQGVVTSDTTIYHTASPSVRITPKSASEEAVTKLFPFQIKVLNGQTATPSVYVRESVVGDGTDYNGNRIKLYVKANINAGITTDTLLDTATASSEGSWEQLTGTTAAVTDDCVLEFYLTCDGTTGWINYDDFTGTTA